MRLLIIAGDVAIAIAVALDTVGTLVTAAGAALVYYTVTGRWPWE